MNLTISAFLHCTLHGVLGYYATRLPEMRVYFRVRVAAFDLQVYNRGYSLLDS
jgi:hypothetical protein